MTAEALKAQFFAANAQAVDRARDFHARGGKVVGYVGATVPVELIGAAGMMPLELRGIPGEATPLADAFMESLFDPAVRSIFQQILAGRFDFLDAIVLPRTDDSQQRLYYYLCELKRLGIYLELPEPVLFDLLHTPWHSSAEYNFSRIEELKQRLETMAGRAIDDAALRRAIADTDDVNRTLREVSEIRRAGKLDALSFLQIFAASRVMEPGDFCRAARALTGQALPTKTGRRVVVAGSALDDVQLYEIVEALGGIVVGDFNARGERMIGPPISAAQPPLRSLAEYYHYGVRSARSYPSDPEEIVRFAQATSADLVCFYLYAHEEGLGWDYQTQCEALTRAGIAHIGFTDQPYVLDDAPIGAQLRALLAGEGGRR